MKRRITAAVASIAVTIASAGAPAVAYVPDKHVLERRTDVPSNGSDRVMNAAKDIHARDIQIINSQGQPITLDGSGTAVGILDDGLDLEHPALKIAPAHPKRMVNGQSVKVIAGSNWTGEEDGFIGSHVKPYHGMHVAGIAAANGPMTNDPDAPAIQGIAPEAQIVFEKVQSSFGPTIVKDDRLSAAMSQAINNGADVINLSLGTDSATSNSAAGIASAIEEAAGRGVPVISTAGNMGYVGNGIAKPLASNPDYGIVARPGLNPLTIDAASLHSTVDKGHAFKIKGVDQEIGFRQPKDKTYAGYWSYIKLDWANYDTWYDYQEIDGQDIDYIMVDNPTSDVLDAMQDDIRGKFVVVPRTVEGLSTPENNPDGKPDYVLALENARKNGAKGVIVVNDSDEEFGYARFFPQLYKAVKVNGNWTYPWDIWDDYIRYPFMVVSKNDGAALRHASTKTIEFNSNIHEFAHPLGLNLSDFSSWGITSDFIFKPDLATPSGYRVISLGQQVNPDDEDDESLGVVLNQGTSMSAPQITGAVALIRQRLNEQWPELVENPNASTVYLIKNLLMSTAVPQMEKAGDYRGHFYSPRVQGNGLLQVKEAATTDVVAVSPSKAGDNETGFAKTNLRMISGDTISFDIELQNYGASPRSYTPYLYVLADNVKDGHYTLHSDTLVEGQQLDSVVVEPRVPGEKQPGKQTFTVSYTLDSATVEKLSSQSPNGFFLDGYVQLVPNDVDNEVELWHSFTGFHGDWTQAPVYDPFIYDLKDGQKPFYYDSTPESNKVGRDGDFNSTHLESRLEGTRLAILGAMPDYTKENLHVSDQHLAISPNGDGSLDSVDPVLTMLRNYQQILIDVTDSSGQSVFSGQYGLGITDKHKNFYSGDEFAGMVTENPKNMRWNGKSVEDETALPEGVYDYKITVIPDYVNGRNDEAKSNLGATRNEDLAVVRTFKIRIDSTVPILKTTKIVREDENNYVVKFDVVDPVLKGTDEPGSGLYKAELISDSGTRDLRLDALNPDSFGNQEFTIPKSEFDTAKLKLTDWAQNARSYTPALTLEGLDTGYLAVTSVNHNGEEVAANYKLVDEANGKEYPIESNIPVGSYRLVPVNLGEGLVPDQDVDMKVTIVKDETTHKTVAFDITDLMADVEVHSDEDVENDRLRDGEVLLRLTNTTTGAQYESSMSAYGSYSARVPFGTYAIDFVGAKPDDHPQVWDEYNHTMDYLVLDKPQALHSFLLTLDERPAGERIVVPATLDDYIEGQTFVTMNGNSGYTPSIEVFAPNDLGMERPLYTIDAKSGTRSVRELVSPVGSPVSTFFFDLTDDQIDVLKPGMILRPVETPPDSEEPLKNSSVALVGYNHPLVNSELEYLKNVANKKADSGEITEADKDQAIKELDNLLYQYADPKSSTKFYIHFRGYAVNRDGAQPTVGDESHDPSVEMVANMLNRASEDVSTRIAKVMMNLNMTADDIPILRIHNGYLPGIRTLLYPTDHDGYSALEVPTTAIVNDPDLVTRTLADHVFNGFTTDTHDKLLIPDGDRDGVGLIPVLRGYHTPRGAVRIDSPSAGEDDISGTDVNDLRVTSQGRSASYDLTDSPSTILKVRAKRKGAGDDLAGQQLTLTNTNDGSVVTVTTDDSGSASFGEIKEGNYTLSRDRVDEFDDEPVSWTVAVDNFGHLIIDGMRNDSKEEFEVIYPRELPTVTSTATTTATLTTEVPVTTTATSTVTTELPVTTTSLATVTTQVPVTVTDAAGPLTTFVTSSPVTTQVPVTVTTTATRTTQVPVTLTTTATKTSEVPVTVEPVPTVAVDPVTTTATRTTQVPVTLTTTATKTSEVPVTVEPVSTVAPAPVTTTSLVPTTVTTTVPTTTASVVKTVTRIPGSPTSLVHAPVNEGEKIAVLTTATHRPLPTTTSMVSGRESTSASATTVTTKQRNEPITEDGSSSEVRGCSTSTCGLLAAIAVIAAVVTTVVSLSPDSGLQHMWLELVSLLTAS